MWMDCCEQLAIFFENLRFPAPLLTLHADEKIQITSQKHLGQLYSICTDFSFINIKLVYQWVMTSKPVEYGFQLMSCTTLVERKSKQTAIDDRPKPMSSPINNPA